MKGPNNCVTEAMLAVARATINVPFTDFMNQRRQEAAQEAGEEGEEGQKTLEIPMDSVQQTVEQ